LTDEIIEDLTVVWLRIQPFWPFGVMSLGE